MDIVKVGRSVRQESNRIAGKNVSRIIQKNIRTGGSGKRCSTGYGKRAALGDVRPGGNGSCGYIESPCYYRWTTKIDGVSIG